MAREGPRNHNYKHISRHLHYHKRKHIYYQQPKLIFSNSDNISKVRESQIAFINKYTNINFHVMHTYTKLTIQLIQHTLLIRRFPCALSSKEYH